MYKKTYDYVCFRCKKKKKSVEPWKTICNGCQAWTKPGLGQINIYGQMTDK